MQVLGQFQGQEKLRGKLSRITLPCISISLRLLPAAILPIRYNLIFRIRSMDVEVLDIGEAERYRCEFTF